MTNPSRRTGLIGLISILNDDGMAACGFLGILMTGKMLDSREVSRCSTKPTKLIAEQEIIFGKTLKKVIPS